VSNKDEVEAALSHDPLDAVEKLTGSYRDNPGLSIMAVMLNGQRKRAALAATDDTAMSVTTPDDFLRIAKEEGFEIVLKEPFAGRDGVQEALWILWHRDGILLVLESYNAYKSVNSAKIYFQSKVDSEGRCKIRRASSSPIRDGVTAFDIDVRDGLRHALANAREGGVLLASWVERPWLWLLTYVESRPGNDYRAINAERIARLPESVRELLGPELAS